MAYRGKSKKDFVTFVRKPIYAAMVLLSKLGDYQIPAEIVDQQTQQPLPNDSYAGTVATTHVPGPDETSDTKQWIVVVYSSSDTAISNMTGKLDFDFTIDMTNAKGLMLAVYAVNNYLSNPYRWWHDVFNKPDFPSLQMFQVIRRNEGPYRHSLTSVMSDAQGKVEIPQMTLQEAEVVLLHLCLKSNLPPEQVTELRMINVTAGQVMVVWSDSSIRTKCIKTYEVEQAADESGPFKRINTDDIIINLFVYATDSEALVAGFYRVRAVDYWNRSGYYSPVIHYAGLY